MPPNPPTNMAEAVRIISLSDNLALCQKTLATHTGMMVTHAEALTEQMATLSLKAASRLIWVDADADAAEATVRAQAQTLGWTDALVALARNPERLGKLRGALLSRRRPARDAAAQPLRDYLEMVAHIKAVNHYGATVRTALERLAPLSANLQEAVANDRSVLQQYFKQLMAPDPRLPRVRPDELVPKKAR